MISVRALGIITSDPQRVEIALGVLQNFFMPPAQADGYGIATVTDDAVLLKRKPGKFPTTNWKELFGHISGGVHIAQFRSPDELRPCLYQSSGANLGPFRVRDFAAVVVGGPQNADQANANREQLLKDVPDFLLHHVLGQTENEAFFIRLVAECLKKNGADSRGLMPALILETIHELLEMLQSKEPRLIAFILGREIVYFSQEMPSALVKINSLALNAHHKQSFLFADSSVSRERLHQFRALILLAGLSDSFQKNNQLPEGMVFSSFAENTRCILQKDMCVKI